MHDETAKHKIVRKVHEDTISMPEIGLDGDIFGYLLPEEAQALYDYALKAPVPLVLELGSFQGKSLCVLGKAMKERGGFVMGLDAFPPDVYEYRNMNMWEDIRHNLKKNNIDNAIVIKGDHSDTLRNMQCSVGMTYIDGGHDVEDIARDFKHAMEFTVPGGYIAFHDYDNDVCPDVKYFVDLVEGKYGLKDGKVFRYLKVFQV